MDSGNSSGSLQSSSGGDEEYDSRAESSISAFMINNPPLQQNHVAGLGPFTVSTTSTTTNSHMLPPQQQYHHMFDPLSNYLDTMQRSPSLPNTNNALLNLDMIWSKPARSEPNQTDLGGLIPCSSLQPQNQQALLSGQVRGQTIRDTSAAFLATQRHSLPDPQSASRGLLSVSAANSNDQPHNTNTSTVRNPKKRSRASRRAPTTVLTTDTTNFRAMVQEFTGIPAPPFTSSPFPRTRLDLFGSAVSTSSTVRSTLLEPSPPPYLLRPFAQKLHHHHLNPFPPSTSSFPAPSSNSMVDTLLASNNSTNSATNSTSINYQISSSGVDHLGLLKQHPLNFNMHNNNPIFSFQNILQAPPKYPLGNPSALASKTQPPSLEIPPPSSGDSHLKVGVFEELGLRHAHVNNNTNVVGGLHQNMVSSPSVGALSSGNNNNNLSNASTEWAQRTGTITNNDCEHGGGGGLGGTVNYSDVAERVTNGKVHYSASSSDFRGEKGPECTLAARSEGMVESWINCSSDN